MKSTISFQLHILDREFCILSEPLGAFISEKILNTECNIGEPIKFDIDKNRRKDKQWNQFTNVTSNGDRKLISIFIQALIKLKWQQIIPEKV